MTVVGQTAAARVIVEELRAYAVRMQIPLFAGGALLSLVRLDWLTGHWQSALALREEVLHWIGRSQSMTYLEVMTDATFAWMHNDAGQPEVAHRHLATSA